MQKKKILNRLLKIKNKNLIVYLIANKLLSKKII